MAGKHGPIKCIQGFKTIFIETMPPPEPSVAHAGRVEHTSGGGGPRHSKCGDVRAHGGVCWKGIRRAQGEWI